MTFKDPHLALDHHYRCFPTMAEPVLEPASARIKTPSDQFWETYLRVAGEEDKYLPDSWEANTNGILTFVRCKEAICVSFADLFSIDRSFCGDSSSLSHREL